MTSLRLQSLWIIGCASVLLAACAPEPPPPLPTPSATVVLPSPTPTSTPAPALPPTQVFPSP
ncbi:MAG: hypothetical protein MUO35_07945, partial [Anaerolineales bacterium]|nr:hypothetical protein [Anaerolineales bacterium]